MNWLEKYSDDVSKAQNGKKKPIYVDSKNDPRYRAYQDSLTLYNATKGSIDKLKSSKNEEEWFNYTKNWGNKYMPTALPAAERLEKLNKTQPSHVKSFEKFNKNSYAGEFKKPQQQVIIKPKENKKKSNKTYKYEGEEKYNKGFPPIYVTDPKDPRIGGYTEKGNQYLYKAPIEKLKLLPKVNPKPQKALAVTPKPLAQAINIPLQEIQKPIQLPKSFNISSQRTNMKGDNDYYNYTKEGVTIEEVTKAQEAAKKYNEDVERRYGNEEALKNPKAVERLKQLKQTVNVTPIYKNGGQSNIDGLTDVGFNYNGAWGGQFQMGGEIYPVNYTPQAQMGLSIPGAVGFSYARTQGAAPSNGKYAKKTMASAQDGKIIEDDMGQWNHPGEITEINSNQITMQGVPYPVLGISDTGDMQMMYPGEDYEYDGKSVTEYPLAKNGKELVKLNQLTNFTNYNKPTVGGWLDKY